ncbi:MAG TPA: P-II family nitrogen regulator [Burkholderiales bacterium]|nr:P-II family nitrogen regulator [Burkholderiales bacterium]
MRQITAVIQPHMLNKVEHTLHALPHFPGYTLLHAKGHARGRASGHAWHATEGDLDEHDKLVIIIFCADALAPQLVDAIREGAHTGLPGDGIIGVCEALEVVRIRTGERGDDAV